MATLHQTTMTPSKREILEAWLPSQPWYRGTGEISILPPAGGFRLADPAGEVGIEFAVAIDAGGDEPVAYHVPMTYRAAADDDGADDEGLITIAEHGVLGRRRIGDATHDPLFVDVLLAFLRGDTEAESRTQSDTLDPRYTAHLEVAGLRPDGPPVTSADGTDLPLRDAAGAPYVLRIVRVLGEGAEDALSHVGSVTGVWTRPDGTEATGAFVLVHG